MKTILEASPNTLTSYAMDDFTFQLILEICDNYRLLYHKPPSMPKALSYLPKKIQDDIVITETPARQPLMGNPHHA
jgi:hypothetical protein